MKEFPVPMEMDNSEFYNNDVSSHGNANFDGNQKNGRHGSPSLSMGSTGQNSSDFGGVNFDNIQIQYGDIKMDISDNMKWESSNGVLIDPTGKFKDWDSDDAKEYDLRPIVQVPGMPSPNDNYNTHCDY